MLKKTLLTLYLSFCATIPTAHADWNKVNFQDSNFTLPYQFYTPKAKGKLPLIIHLHGSGEAGTDNEAQMYSGTNFGPQYFANDDNQKIQPSFVLAPQTPKPMRWASTSLDPYVFKSTPSTPSMTALLHLIDKIVIKNKNIDPNRIYITGLSRGGQGVWNAMLQRPKLFAAALPIAGSSDPSEAKTIATIPIWVFAGDLDEVTNVKFSREMVDSIIRAGGSTANVRYTEIEGGNHEASWKTAYNNSDVYKWLVKHSK
ncbi:carboxylesterase family protein [Aliivibrio fischeri]|uniref:carboxylesterase family protein n=1 Tax=Aliivibrio fischeri TaxID=668 RepID=UPI00084BD5E1|nr:prolyl oligopeptidase family serine peptidase [Aliivibrio fischeri]OED58134.1 phospholipase [Aliivibrio fischeri]